MKKVIFSLALFLTCSLLGYAQKGISYQAVILDPKPIEIPGQDITGQPFVNGAVSLKFKIFSSTFVQEFEEVHATQTDAYGMVNVLIGSVSQGAFSSLVWDSNAKNMQVWVSFDQGGTYTKVSEQQLTYNPYAFYSETAGTAGKLAGTLGIAEGGTGATTAVNARTNLGLGNVDNTADVNKPISSATQTALNTKANAAEVNTALATKANAVEVTSALATKANADEVTTALGTKANATEVTTALATKANASEVTSALNTKASTSDLAAGLALKLDANQKGIANGVATLNSSGIIPSSQLPPVTLSSTTVVASAAEMLGLSSATVGSIAIRTDVAKNFVLRALPASTVGNWIELLTPAAPVQTVNGYTGSVNLAKSDLGLGNVDNTADASKPISNATQQALDLKANTADVNAALSTMLSTADATAALNLKLDANKVGVANGTASLNALRKIPTDQIPAISFSSVNVLGSQAEMLALTTAVVGSVVIRTDVNKNYVLAQANPSLLANWIELLTPAPPVQTVNGYTGTVSLTKSDLGLGNVDNTLDANKPISTASQLALDTKANADDVNTALATKANAAEVASFLAQKEDVANKSTNINSDANSDTKYPSVRAIKNYVDNQVSTSVTLDGTSDTKYPSVKSVKTYVDQIAGNILSGQVNSDWNATAGAAKILNKPTLFSGAYSDLTGKPTLFSGSYTDLTNKPTLPAAQVSTDWNATAGVAQVLNKPTLFSGAYSDLTGKPTLFSGSYTDLTNKPTLPAAQVSADWNATAGVTQVLNKPTLFSGAYADLTGPIPTWNQNTTGNAATATLATNAGNITATSNTSLTSLANLNTVGTLTSGTWNASTIAVVNGGTGATTATAALTNLGAAPVNANLNDQTGTTYLLDASDNGKVVTLNNASAITLTVPAGLPAGFNCMIVQKGAGIVTLTPANTVTVTNRSGGTRTGGRNAIVTIISISSNYFITGGDMQ